MPPQIIIDPRHKYNYAGFYVLGLQQLYGKSTIRYEVDPFRELPYATQLQYNSGVPFVVRQDGKEVRIFVDTEDQAKIEPERYQWCDLYAKINVAFGDTDRYAKLLPIGPSFGIPHQSLVGLMTTALCHYAKGRGQMSIPLSTFVRDHLYTRYRRRPLETYSRPTAVRDNYIFHASTLWYDHTTDKSTNRFRGEFLKAAQRAGLTI